MKVKPHKWTHHHSLRLFHISFFMSWIFIFSATSWGLTTVLFFVHADQSITVNASVPDVIIGQTTTGGSFAYSPVLIPEKDNKLELSLFIHPSTNITTEEVVVNNKTEIHSVVNSLYPKFYGHSSQKNGIIFFEIHSQNIIKGSTYANENGDWQWQTPEPLNPGKNIIYASLQSNLSSPLSQTKQLNFYIGDKIAIDNYQPKTTKLPDTANGPTLLNVYLKIPQKYKTIAPGDEAIANIQLVNFGDSGKTFDVPISYIITDSEHNIVAESSETVAIQTSISLIKSFVINISAHEGLYTVTAKVPSKGIIATASDTFNVKGEPVILLSQTAKVDFTLVIQFLIAVLFLSGLVLYFEYNKVNALSFIIHKVSENDFKALSH